MLLLFSCLVISLLIYVRLCLDQLLYCVWSVPNREVAECHLVDKLCNINTAAHLLYLLVLVDRLATSSYQPVNK